MKEFQLPDPVSDEVAKELRLTTSIASDDNWAELKARGWAVVSSGPSTEWYLHDVVPNSTYRATQEASRRAGVYIEPTSVECGRVAMGFLSNEPMWHDWGYGLSKKAARVAIANPEPLGDELFIKRIPRTEQQLALVGDLVINTSYGASRNLIYAGPILRAAGDYLAGSVDSLDLLNTARTTHDELQRDLANLERLRLQHDRQFTLGSLGRLWQRIIAA